LLFSAYCIGAGAATWVVFRATDRATLHALMLAWGFFSVGCFSVLALYLTELYPTHVRATGQGFTWNAARLLTAGGPAAAARRPPPGRAAAPRVRGLAFSACVPASAFGPEPPTPPACPSLPQEILSPPPTLELP